MTKSHDSISRSFSHIRCSFSKLKLTSDTFWGGKRDHVSRNKRGSWVERYRTASWDKRLREDLKNSAWSRRRVPSRWPVRPNRKSFHLGTLEGKRACDLHSPPAFPNLVSRRAGSRVISQFPKVRGRLALERCRHPRVQVTDSQADLAD